MTGEADVEHYSWDGKTYPTPAARHREHRALR
jgi:hypothetical protein